MNSGLSAAGLLKTNYTPKSVVSDVTETLCVAKTRSMYRTSVIGWRVLHHGEVMVLRVGVCSHSFRKFRRPPSILLQPPPPRKGSTHRWRASISNHRAVIVAYDFFTLGRELFLYLQYEICDLRAGIEQELVWRL